MPDRRRPPLPALDLDLVDDEFAYDEREGSSGGGGRRPAARRRGRDDHGHEDVGLFRMLGLLVLIAVVVVVLVLPASPLHVTGRLTRGVTDGRSESAGQGISARALAELPSLPPGLTAVSRLYELSVPEGLAGSQSIEIALTESTGDGKNLGFYAYEGQAWRWLGVAVLTPDGKSASGELPSPPKSVAVLRSTVSARSLGVIVEGGQAPDAHLTAGAAIVAARGAALGKDAKTLTVRAGALDAPLKAAGGKPVYLVVSAGPDAKATAGQLGPELAASITAAVKAQGAGGVLVDLGVLPREQREPMSRFAAELSARLRAERRGFLMGVPAAGSDGGAYDWKALLDVADGLWLIPRVDPGSFYTEVDLALRGARESGVDTARVALVIDRRSQETWTGQQSSLTRRDALALASTIVRTDSGGGGTGSTSVHLSAPFLAGSGGGLRWDERAKAVSFAFSERGTPHTVWIENRFSVAFRLELAGRHGLGGIVMDQAEAGDGLAEIAEPVTAFVQGTPPVLQRPYGPYLAPCWQALGGGTIEDASECWKQDLAVPSAAWRAPRDAGSYTVRLVVSDGVAFIGQERTLQVQPGGRVELLGTTATNSTATNNTGGASGAAPSRPPGPAGN